MKRIFHSVALAALLTGVGFTPPPPAALAASAPGSGTAAPTPRTALPQEHEYQRTLRTFLGSLSEKDFDPGVMAPFKTLPDDNDPEEQYRCWMLGRMIQPLMGTKRGMPSFSAPGRDFVLGAIETPKGLIEPPAWPEPVAFLIKWDYAGNPFRQSRAMKLRAFVTMCVHMTLVDDQLEHAPETIANRSDLLAPTLIMLSYPYPVVKDVLPGAVRRAYETGLRKMGRRILDWGPKGEEPNMDLIAPVALWYAGGALDDEAFAKEAQAYARRLFADERCFNPAGYFVDHGGIDLGYAGQSNFLAVWLALATKWPFVIDAVDRIYRLRAHLCLREPDGRVLGPCEFHTRFSAEAARDQWAWDGYRDTAASFVTDEAACLTRLPPHEELTGAIAARAVRFQEEITETPMKQGNGSATMPYIHFANDEIRGFPYEFRVWESWSFPTTVSFAYEYYPRGAYARRLKLEKENSPFLKPPFEREDRFVRAFGDSFTVTRQPGYAAIVHTGPVGAQDPESSQTVLPGPYGFGGGQLAAFWTPATGSVILGRRGGMKWDKNFDNLEDWRLWPVHAVSGAKTDGKVFTSARIRRPEVASELGKDRGTVCAGGVIPNAMFGQGKVLEGRLQYARTFTVERGSLKVQTSLRAAGQDTIAELYETLPVFLREAGLQPDATPTAIEFMAGGKWSAAGTQWTPAVSAVRLTRFKGQAIVTFDRPRRVKLSAGDWHDAYLSGATCRNVLIDLLENEDRPLVLNDTKTVSYTLAPAGEPDKVSGGQP